MRVDAIELRQVRLPMVAPLRASHGTERDRHVVVVRLVGDGAEGWGECVALTEPTYTSEFAAGAAVVLRDHLAPRLVGTDVTGAAVIVRLADVRGHPMAKSSLEMAVLDAELRAAGRSFADRLGATRRRVPSGITLGLGGSIPALVDDVAAAVAAGYRRVKLKIAPGWDVEPLEAVRSHFPDVVLFADANGAYTAADAPHLARLDEFGLAVLEQPFAADDVGGHAALRRRSATPVGLDESITSPAAAEQAMVAGACDAVGVKPGPVGGYLEAVRVHDRCRAAGVPAWVGGMVETGLGRAGNIALAALDGFTLPGDLSPSDRWFADDLTEPLVMEDGYLAVPSGPGLGVDPLPDALARFTTDITLVRP